MDTAIFSEFWIAPSGSVPDYCLDMPYPARTLQVLCLHTTTSAPGTYWSTWTHPDLSSYSTTVFLTASTLPEQTTKTHPRRLLNPALLELFQT